MNGSLGNCGHVQINADKSTLALWIETEKNDDFCPISVKIKLKDDKFFLLPLPKGDYHNIPTNNKQYSAFNLEGGFYKNLILIRFISSW